MEQYERSATGSGKHLGERLANRNTWRIGAAGEAGVLGLLAVAAYVMFVSLPDRVRVAPVSIVVHSSTSLPAEVQTLEAQTAPLLFGHDTGPKGNCCCLNVRGMV
jgi:hypothetical protein